jgi:hypothetical protein
MVSQPCVSPRVLCACLWRCIIFHRLPPTRPVAAAAAPAAPQPMQPTPHRSHAPTPCAGLPHTPHGARCARDTGPPHAPPLVPPAPRPATQRRPRHSAPPRPVCPPAGCDSRGGRGVGQLRAPDPPRGGPWRPGPWPSGPGDWLEPPGTLVPGQPAAGERLVRRWACLAAGWGSRATARVCAVAPQPGLPWRAEAAAPRRAFSAAWLCQRHLAPRHLDAGDAVRRACKAGARTAAAASERLERSPSWVWTALAPTRTLLVGGEVGCRPLALAHRVVPQVRRGLAPGGGARLLTEGRKASGTAFLTPGGCWRHPERRQDRGPSRQPRCMPRPAWCSAPGGKSSRRRRIGGGKHRVVCGAGLAIEPRRARGGWPINPAVGERRHLDLRPGVAALGRRGNPRGQGAAGWQDRLGWFPGDHTLGVPHASLRQRWPVPEATSGRGSAKVWRPWTPARAAGLTAPVWSRKAGLFSRGPPWLQPQTM